MADKKSDIKLNMLEPRATEKSYLEQTNRTYVFPIKKTTSKQAIAKKVEEEFKVTVTDVRTLIRKGKKTKFSKGKHSYPGITHRQDKKLAYVTLKKGDFIRVFEEEAPKEDKTSAKEAGKAEKAKKVDKNAGKENK